MSTKTVEAARGKWAGILAHFGVDANVLNGKHQPCPICNGGRDRFRFDNRDGAGTFICTQCGAGQGIKLLMSLKGWDFKTAAAEIDKIVGNVQVSAAIRASDPARRIKLITDRLQGCSEHVRQYLLGRNLKPCKGIKSARVEYYDDGVLQGDYDCMVLPIQNRAGVVISYHITYLQNAQKANVRSPKKMLPPSESMQGAVIRLTDIYPVIGLAEGIETALAVMETYKIPCWAASCANMMETFQPPEGVTGVVIYADNDLNFTGQKAAYVLANRLAIQGLTTGVFIPNEVGDFADTMKTNNAEQVAA